MLCPRRLFEVRVAALLSPSVPMIAITRTIICRIKKWTIRRSFYLGEGCMIGSMFGKEGYFSKGNCWRNMGYRESKGLLKFPIVRSRICMRSWELWWFKDAQNARNTQICLKYPRCSIFIMIFGRWKKFLSGFHFLNRTIQRLGKKGGAFRTGYCLKNMGYCESRDFRKFWVDLSWLDKRAEIWIQLV